MSPGHRRPRKAINCLHSCPHRHIHRGCALHVAFDSKPVQFESVIRADGKSCVQEERASVVVGEAANDTPDIEALAGMLTRGEFPPDYDSIIRNISDEDLERLWACFNQKLSHSEAEQAAARKSTARVRFTNGFSNTSRN